MSTFTPCDYPILFKKDWQTTNLARAIAKLDRNDLCDEYKKLVQNAPRRSDRDKCYFVRHDGKHEANDSNRREEILAMALWNLRDSWPPPGDCSFRLLDYQFPLKAQQSDLGIGKVDLLGVTDQGRLIVIELKVKPSDGSRGESPMKALMEGLRYAAIVKANRDMIALEAKDHHFPVEISAEPPLVQLLAPKAWWEGWLNMADSTRKAAELWEPEFAQLLQDIEKKLCLAVECVELDDTEIVFGSGQRTPQPNHPPALYPVRLTIDKAPDPHRPKEQGVANYFDYEKDIRRTLWTWADRHHWGELDGGKREGRPPVLAGASVSKNILLPTDESKASKIRAAISEHQRHRWFGSLKSSQALAQSVFGALQAFDRLDLLQSVHAECGRSAFFEDYHGWTLEFEHEVDNLGEESGRRTSVDVLLSGPEKRVPIECKFTEEEFGTCSRPRLPCSNEQHCDGSYRVQRGRNHRCALTEINIRYWDHLPRLFHWQADRDHDPCPFWKVYQLARNALAATLTGEGALNHTGGHALVVYDARNPEFQVKGKAEKQWQQAVNERRIPGLLRRLSWQRLMVAVARAPELKYLVDAAGEKYGIDPVDPLG